MVTQVPGSQASPCLWPHRPSSPDVCVPVSFCEDNSPIGCGSTQLQGDLILTDPSTKTPPSPSRPCSEVWAPPVFWGCNSAHGIWLSVSQVVLVVKNPPANPGDSRDTSLIPGLERPPGEGNSSPLLYSCLENPMDRGA